MSTEPPAIRHHDGVLGAALVDQLADAYVDARSEPPYNGEPPWNKAGFIGRTTRQAADPGFALVTAHDDGKIVGFAFGRPIAPQRWFEGDTAPPPEILAATKFAVIELDVRPAWRNRGIGHALLDALLADRPEEYGMLSTLPDTPARAMYQRWGWRKAATTEPDSGLPPWETFVLPLTGTSTPEMR